jgi:hypothetical protein
LFGTQQSDGCFSSTGYVKENLADRQAREIAARQMHIDARAGALSHDFFVSPSRG